MKSYTDLEQSKKLAKILSLESADMRYHTISHYNPYPCDEIVYTVDFGKPSDIDVPCWSLAALLNVLPKDEGIDCSISFGYYNGKGEYIEKWLCAFEKEGETTDDFIIETIDGDNPIDACVAMIEKLHELKML